MPTVTRCSRISTPSTRSCAPIAATASPTAALADVRARARVFGLHLAKLDVRVHASAVRAPDERLRRTLGLPRGRRQRHGARALDRLIVSMTQTAGDVLDAEALAAEAGADVQGVPLLETIDDLRRARPSSSRSCSTAARARRSR